MTIEGDRYFSIEDGPEVEVRVLASRFLAQALRAESDEGARARLAHTRRVHHDATHHSWAARFGAPGEVVERADDDGEPGGTAGAPILAAITHADRYDAIVIVTRWFGGTKLGTGGLARAYGEAARAAIDAAPARELWRESTLVVECEWNDVGVVEAVLAREARAVRRCVRNFALAPRFEIAVVRSRLDAVHDALREGTAGRARVV